MRVSAGAPEHEQCELVLKKARVDKYIAPIVQWINSHPEAFTLASCQGTEIYKPYVFWICLDPIETQQILRELPSTTIRFNHVKGMMTYTSNWTNVPKLLDDCVKFHDYNREGYMG